MFLFLQKYLKLIFPFDQSVFSATFGLTYFSFYVAQRESEY